MDPPGGGRGDAQGLIPCESSLVRTVLLAAAVQEAVAPGPEDRPLRVSTGADVGVDVGCSHVRELGRAPWPRPGLLTLSA